MDWEELLEVLGLGPSDFELGLLYFIGRAFGGGVSSARLSRDLAAMAFWFKLRGFCDYSKSFLVRQAVRGFRRGTVTRDRRRPVSYELLLQLGQVLRDLVFDGYEWHLFLCAFSLAFFGAFRISELVAPSRVRVGGLLGTDVRCEGSAVHCFLRRSKTDQAGKGVVVSLRELPGSAMCPVHALRSFVALRPSGAVPLLVHADGTFLSKYQFIQVFRNCLSRLGLEAKDYCSHSFRIGAATEAARWGLGAELVKRIGRWESDRFKLYIRPHLL